MKRFSRLPSFEALEEKRLKAADLINNMSAHGAAMEAVPTAATGGGTNVATSTFQTGGASKASLTSEQTDDDTDSNDEENETDDASESDNVDQTDDNESDESDENESETDETDGTDDDETSQSDDNESDDNESDDNESDDNESDDNESDDTEDQNTDDDNDSDEDESDDNDDSENDNETELSTDLTATTGNSGTGTAEFESESDDGSTEREFSLEVKGATTNSSLVNGTQEVRVGGVLVGNISLTNGNGKLEFNSDADDDETPFPADFPTTVDATTTVAVGPNNAPILTGTFATSSAVKSSSLLGNEDASGSQAPGPESLLAVSTPSRGLDQAGSSLLPAGGVEVPNVAEANSVDLNLLDLGFAAPAESNAMAQHARQPDDLSNHDDRNVSQSLDAVFESLIDGDLASPLL